MHISHYQGTGAFKVALDSGHFVLLTPQLYSKPTRLHDGHRTLNMVGNDGVVVEASELADGEEWTQEGQIFWMIQPSDRGELISLRLERAMAWIQIYEKELMPYCAGHF